MQVLKSRTRWVALASVMLWGSLAGCAQHKAGQSGFLDNYAQLTESPMVQGALAYTKPGTSLSQYDKFIVEPISIHFSPNAEGITIAPAKLAELAQYLEDEAVKALSERYQVVSAPGPGVLRLRVALTDIQKGNPLLNIHPGTKLSGVGIGGASMEGEATDSVTGERILAAAETRQGERFSFEGLGPFDHAKQAMRHWVKRFVKRLDEAHGYSQ